MPLNLQSLQPQYVLDSELSKYGLPSVDTEPNIISYIQKASSLIDQHCGRIDTTGWGSLVWTTYTERLFLPEGRNITRLTYKPPVAIDPVTYANYGASGVISFAQYGVSGTTNLLAPNTQLAADGVRLSPIVALAGRYGYGRRAQQQVYPDLNYGANILQIASYFGGPPQFTPIDVSMTDYEPLTGEIWIPAGLYLSAYTEIWAVYNAGFPPDAMPYFVKNACATLVFNYLATPATRLRSFGVGSVHHEFTPDLIDSNIANMLNPVVNTVAY